ncbi:MULTISPECIES: Fic family protein [Pseudomonas]|uniref:Fic family protein n=1 Tax=Pseudomonas TaxID=286 RepID=UPI00235F5020|nr:MULTISPECIES: Fic family protein [Pseudomonas]WJV26251.1 Fic family protein [Pseudomonas chlororaphis]
MSSLCTATTVYRLNPLIYPAQADLAETTLNALAVANTLLNTCEHAHSPIKLERLPNLLTEEGVISRLRHPLFAHYAAFNTHVPLGDRTLVERRHFEGISSAFKETLTDISYPTICTFLNTTSQLIGGSGSIRDLPIGLTPDKQGRTTLFIDAAEIEGTLINLWQYMAKRPAPQCDLFSALIAIVGLLNCHPFNDGNGRVARVLLNILLARSEHNYIPWYDFYHCTPGGYTLRLRQAQLFGEWDELVLFHCTIIKVMSGQ